jgi:HEAT repeat protein
MLLAAAFVACLLQQPKQPPAPAPPTPGSILLGGANVPLVSPTTPTVKLGDDVLAWPGWGPLHTGAVAQPFEVDGNWADMPRQWTALAPDPNAVTWRVKVFLLTDSDSLATESDGTVVETPSSLGKDQVASVMQSLVLAARTMEVQTGGHVNVEYDFQQDDDRIESDAPGGLTGSPSGLEAYVTPRINGGSFEANDRIYRGPYHLCLVIHPGLRGDAATNSVVCLTPMATLSAPKVGDTVGKLATAILAENAWAASWWSERQGFKTAPSKEASEPIDLRLGYLWSAFGDRTPAQIATFANFGPVNRAAYSNATEAAPSNFGTVAGAAASAHSSLSTGASVSLVSDTDKGQVLKVDLRTAARQGGVALPTPADLPALSKGPNHFLVFEVKTLSKDALAIGTTGAQGPMGKGVELGDRPDPGLAAALPADGAWHKVAIDLSQIVTDDASGLYLGNLPGQDSFERDSIVDYEYTFGAFTLAPAAPAEAVAVNQRPGLLWRDRVAKIRAALADPKAASNATAINDGLSSDDDEVRLNTLSMLVGSKAAAFEPKIVADIGSLNRRVVDEAIKVLAAMDTPSARKALDDAARSGSPHTRASAALAVALRKDLRETQTLSGIMRLRSWQVRSKGILAEAANGGPVAQILIAGTVRADFEPDPAVRALAVSVLDPSNAEIMRQIVLFSSVNDPSDAVRVVSCRKLLECKDAALRKEGYHGANDDSPWVRLQLLDTIRMHPSEEATPALKQAITSPYGAVRAAALEALAANPGVVTIDDLSPVLADSLPEVERALIHLAVEKKLALPAPVVTRLKGSSNPNVAADATKLTS